MKRIQKFTSSNLIKDGAKENSRKFRAVLETPPFSQKSVEEIISEVSFDGKIAISVHFECPDNLQQYPFYRFKQAE